jgi:hypothetical protein
MSKTKVSDAYVDHVIEYCNEVLKNEHSSDNALDRVEHMLKHINEHSSTKWTLYLTEVKE